MSSFRKITESHGALTYREFIQREETFIRAPFNPEKSFYDCVVSGDIEQVDKLTDERMLEKREGWGVLSKNELQNLKYHFVITTAVLARYCIHGGMQMQEAYNLSDYYILQADEATTVDAIVNLHKPMCLDYTRRMHDLQKNKASSVHVIRCIDYIYNNLHTRITIEQLSKLTNRSSSYLSKLFKEEVGMSITDYILDCKIKTAKNMLLYSDYSSSDIAAFLAFPSQSYFCEIFKKKTGITPSRFRNTNSV